MNLRKLRHEKNWTLLYAAATLRTNAGNLSRIERGEYYPSVPLAKRIAQEYGITLDEIFDAKREA